MSEFYLTPAEKSSALWKKLLAHFNEKLDRAREKNDSDKEERATAQLRGRIAELKEAIALDYAAPIAEDEE